MKNQPKTMDTPRHTLPKANFAPDLSEFLYLLQPPDLQALAELWGITADLRATDKLTAIETILQYLDKNPDQRLRSDLTIGTRTQRFTIGNKTDELPLPDDFQLPVAIDVLFEEDVTLKADTTYVTEGHVVQFKGKLKMEPGAKFFGGHHLGLSLEVRSLECPRLAVQPSWQRTVDPDTPVISTAIKMGQEWDDADELLNDPRYFERVSIGGVYLYQMQNNEAVKRKLNIHGYPGQEGAKPSTKRGKDGEDSTPERAATDGQPPPLPPPLGAESPPPYLGEEEDERKDSSQGYPGQPGREGHSPQPLRIHIKDRLYGHVLFDARGGNGGRGGQGGQGRSFFGGNGGSVQVKHQIALAIQGLPTEPGKGGESPSKAGLRGQGGNGGRGGRGGNIELIIDDQADIDEGQFLIYTKGGEGGAGGAHGRRGMTRPGRDGNVYSSFGIIVQGQRPEVEGIAIEKDEDKPEPSVPGNEAVHGSITINGHLIPEANGNNRNKETTAYSYPPLPQEIYDDTTLLVDTLLDPDLRGFLPWEKWSQDT